MDKSNTAAGRPVTDQHVTDWSHEAEVGYEVPALKKRGRPRIGSAVAQVATLRLDPGLDAALTARAERDQTTRSGVMRDALRSWLEAS